MTPRALLVALAAVLLVASPGAAADTTAPVATIAPKPDLLVPAEVAFNEPVQGVTASNLTLRVESVSSSLPASVSCRSSSGAAVACSSTSVRRAILRPRTPLVPGEKYVATLNPDGATPVRDRAGNPAARRTSGFRGWQTQEENSKAASFRWRGLSDPAAHGGTYVTERSRGATATFRFSGSSVSWHTITGPDQGTAKVLIDGTVRAAVDNFSATRRTKVARTFAGLGAGAHSLTVWVNGEKGTPVATDTMVAVDAFSAGGALSSSPVLTFGARRPADSSALGGAFATTDVPGARWTFTFRGTGVDWVTIAAPNQGRADLYVDGVRRATVDNYAAVKKYGVVRRLRHLSDRVHTLAVVVRGDRHGASSDTAIAVDRFVARATDLTAFRKLGAWVDVWDYTGGTPNLQPAASLADLAARGVRTLYIQTARYPEATHFRDPARLGAWVDAAKAKGIKVVGWYLPGYDDMDRDVARSLAIKSFRSPSGHAIDAIGIDIEYRGELDANNPEWNSTRLRQEFMARIGEHLTKLRARAGTSTPIGAIVPSTVGMQIGGTYWEGFPWTTIGKRADFVLPMAYWTYRTAYKQQKCDEEPDHCPYRYGRLNTTQSAGLSGLPVHPIGGVMGPETTLIKQPSVDVRDFVRGARDGSARGCSLYDYATIRGWPAATQDLWWSQQRACNAM